MIEHRQRKLGNIAIPIALAGAVAFLYAAVLAKLGVDWWFDENYSHGLLVPFIIAFIIWREWPDLLSAGGRPLKWVGGTACLLALPLLFAGTLGAELFTSRISFALMLAGIVLYFRGSHLLRLLAVPFGLLLLAIPIPQILFNRIAFPLQIWASQMAVWGIRLVEVPTVRSGNVIDILPRGATQAISLEVVEACSGIRSLMTLMTLALILVYFTRRNTGRLFLSLRNSDLWRALILMCAAAPIAVLTNAARVTATGVMTYRYGRPAAEGAWHDVSGWLIYIAALALLVSVDVMLRRVFRGQTPLDEGYPEVRSAALSWRKAAPLIAALVLGGTFINWFIIRPEPQLARSALAEFPAKLGDWQQKGGEFKFEEQVESVLRTTDYTMREYTSSDGRIANVYIGYYASQRTGSTYHSPQNCLPGAGWVLTDHEYVDVTAGSGRTFRVNRYIITNGVYREVMLYWYQGRGRTEASEYLDKLDTIWDSITRQRSDGAIIRIMTGVGSDGSSAEMAAVLLAAQVSDRLEPFVPD